MRTSPLPLLLLQPLLENAIKHGISHLVEGGTIEIIARRVDDRLNIEITNPVDASDNDSGGEGIGLGNVVGRLELLYRGRAQLEVRNTEGQFRVSIDLPPRSGEEPSG